MVKIFLTISIFIFPAISFCNPSVFSIGISGEGREIYYQKIRAEIKTVKTKKFCKRGSFPVRMSSWKCLTYQDQITKCRTNFRCQRSTRKFRRNSLLMSLQRKVTENLVLVDDFKIHVYKDLEKRVVPIYKKQKPPKKTTSVMKKSKQQKKIDLKSKSELEAISWKKKYIAREKEDLLSIDKQDGNHFQEDFDELPWARKNDVRDMTLKAKWLVKETTETSSGRKYVKLTKKDQVSIKTQKNTQLMNFSSSYSIINDREQNSLSTMSAAWTPHYWFNESLGLRGKLGFHFLQTKLLDAEAQKFLATDLAFLGIFHFRNIYLEGGLGIQKWSEPQGDTHNVLLLGVGYKFSNYVFNIIERVYFNYNSIGNEEENKEMHFGFGISFF